MKIILVILETFYNSVIYRTRSIKMYLALQNKKGNKELGGLKKKEKKKHGEGGKNYYVPHYDCRRVCKLHIYYIIG